MGKLMILTNRNGKIEIGIYWDIMGIQWDTMGIYLEEL
jgi:hypothetical protein